MPVDVFARGIGIDSPFFSCCGDGLLSLLVFWKQLVQRCSYRSGSYQCGIVVLVAASTEVAAEQQFLFLWKRECCNHVVEKSLSTTRKWQKKIELVVVYQVVSDALAAATIAARHRKEDFIEDGIRNSLDLVSTRDRIFLGAKKHQNKVFVTNLNRIYAVKIIDFELRFRSCELQVEFISQGIRVPLHLISKGNQLFLRILALV